MVRPGQKKFLLDWVRTKTWPTWLYFGANWVMFDNILGWFWQSLYLRSTGVTINDWKLRYSKGGFKKKELVFLAQNLNFDRLGIIYVSRTACRDIISYFLPFHYLSSVSVEKYFLNKLGLSWAKLSQNWGLR